MTDIIIRAPEPRDAAALAVYMEALVAEDLGTITLRKAPTIEEEQAFIARAEAAERGFILVAMDGDRVVGLLDLFAGAREHEQHVGRFGMSTAKGWRGKGLGRRMLERAIEMTKEWPGFCRIELEVLPHNTAAIHLYESLGFVLEARREKGTNIRGSPEDILMMALVW